MKFIHQCLAARFIRWWYSVLKLNSYQITKTNKIMSTTTNSIITKTINTIIIIAINLILDKIVNTIINRINIIMNTTINITIVHQYYNTTLDIMILRNRTSNNTRISKKTKLIIKWTEIPPELKRERVYMRKSQNYVRHKKLNILYLMNLEIKMLKNKKMNNMSRTI